MRGFGVAIILGSRVGMTDAQDEIGQCPFLMSLLKKGMTFPFGEHQQRLPRRQSEKAQRIPMYVIFAGKLRTRTIMFIMHISCTFLNNDGLVRRFCTFPMPSNSVYYYYKSLFIFVKDYKFLFLLDLFP